MDGRIKTESHNVKEVYTEEQYFEQRKRRQQQQQQTAGSEGYADETSVGGKHQKECRSLDILSLLNLSTVSDERKSCPNSIFSHVRRDGKIDTLTMKYHIPKDPTRVITNSVPPSYSVEIKQAGAPPSSYQGDPKVLFCNHENHALNGINSSPDLWNAATEKQLSVFDMLNDEASEDSSDKSLVHEAHVAFSVEGLGKIRTETPLHSPKQQTRISSDDCSLTWNVGRQLNSSKSSKSVLNDLELEVEVMMQDNNIQLGGSPSEFSMDTMDSHGNWKPELPTVTDHMQLYSHCSNRKCSLGDTNIFYNRRRREDIWDARLSFLDDDFLHERKDDVSWEYQPHKMDRDSGDFLEYEKGEISDDSFEAHHMLKKRDVKATKLRSLEPPSPERTSSEVDHRFTTSIGLRHNPVQGNYDTRDFAGQLDWPFLETEDAKDTLSLLSEESCSSSAVKGETINISPPNQMPRQSRTISNTFGRTRKKYDMDNAFAVETHCEDGDNLGQRSRKCVRTPVLPKSKATKSISSCFRGKIGPSQTWFFEEGCNSVDIDLGFSSSHCTSEANLPSLESKLWTEDPIGAFPVPELNFDVKSCFARPKPSESIQCSPFGRFTSEKFAFRQSINHKNSYNSPVFSNVGSGSIQRDLSRDSRMQGVPLDSSNTAGPHRETGFPDLSVQRSIRRDDKRKSNFRPANCEQFPLEKETYPGDDLLFSEDPMAMDGSNPNNNDVECEESKDGTLKEKETYSPEHGEEESSSVKIHDKSNSSPNEKGYNYEEILLPCQSGAEGPENAKLEEGKAISGRQNNGEDSSSKQVMMLESHVIQLLCVEKW
ncbi:uncharacterized protein LOC111286460 isoform X3 [Durio zibethinus]|uniref:Uncharacterized protein LOC111286460 isoform X3 n=1 Tax=Durio zibethinus TaxID=66656 RepID=A0A6P5XVV7_DURZI|nr:uncharacterized protein LOC111286460 isoform X3 [Durio zibethinus]